MKVKMKTIFTARKFSAPSARFHRINMRLGDPNAMRQDNRPAIGATDEPEIFRC
jgi:hypothetical protein